MKGKRIRVTLPLKDYKAIEKLVKAGTYESVNAFVNEAVKRLLQKEDIARKKRYEEVYKWKLRNSQSTILGLCSTPENVTEIILEELKNPDRKKHNDWVEERDKWNFEVIELVKEQKVFKGVENRQKKKNR